MERVVGVVTLETVNLVRQNKDMKTEIDHIIWATSEPERDRTWFQDTLNMTITPGGAHAGFGTRNDLIGLSNDGLYLEIIYPDPDQSSIATIAKAMSTLTSGGVYHWAARHPDLDVVAKIANENGIAHTGKVPVKRTLADGTEISWNLLFLRGHGFGGVIPFFIDWAATPHPSKSLKASHRMESLTLLSPCSDDVTSLLGLFGLSVTVEYSTTTSIRAVMSDGAKSTPLPAAEPFKNGFAV